MKTLARFTILAIICCIATRVNAQRSHLLKGSIGKFPVMMQVFEDDSSCSASYFYLNQRKDILLEGSINEKKEFYLFDTTIVYEFFSLKKNNNGFEGSWTNKQQTLPVTLTYISIDTIHSKYDHLESIKAIREKDSLQYLKIAGLEFIKDSVSGNGIATLEWYHEKYSGIQLPRIKTGYTANAIKKMNEVLLERHLTESDNYLTCMSTSRYPEFSVSTDYVFATKELFSLNLGVGYFCGGGHPDFYQEGLNFDARTGTELTLESVYRFDKGSTPIKEDTDDWYHYRDNEFSEKIVSILSKLYPKQMKEDDCYYNEAEVWKFPNWYFTEKGLYIGATFGSAGRACNYPEWSVVPYKLLKPYLAMKKPFQLLLK